MENRGLIDELIKTAAQHAADGASYVRAGKTKINADKAADAAKLILDAAVQYQQAFHKFEAVSALLVKEALNVALIDHDGTLIDFDAETGGDPAGDPFDLDDLDEPVEAEVESVDGE